MTDIASRSEPPRWRVGSERGQSTIEWAGVLVLVATIIAAVISLLGANAVAQAADCALHRLFQGSCSVGTTPGSATDIGRGSGRGTFMASGVVNGAMIPALPARDSYDYDYSVPGADPSMSGSDVAAFVTSHFSDVFPFGGCGEQIHVGDACQLQFLGQSAPIRVVAIGPTSFTFESMPGHPEGPYRFITFSFATDGKGQVELTVHADGPATLGSEGTIHTGVAWAFWQDFALKLGWALAHR